MLQTGSTNLLTSKLLVGFNDCLQLKSEWPEPLRFMPCINIKDSKRTRIMMSMGQTPWDDIKIPEPIWDI